MKDEALDHRGQLLRQPAFQAGGDVARGEQGVPQPVLAVAHGPKTTFFYPSMNLMLLAKTTYTPSFCV